ncbi:uncharacterized protein LTR77_003835 [Saxophila tyrrhenica]|uniref:Uncharacterized protein n=1 Tax=Saxophila tyrrhenica TaxID=1690608 RepID=A0AAV9PIT5_9PEZI|nr:hypothetical protein LTR77_003835 [Saxophila tyrrhenica]
MAQTGQNTTLSTSARLLCYLGPPSVVLATSYISPKTGLLSPLAFVPTAYAYRKWREVNASEPSRRAPLEPLVWTYALMCTAGIAAVSALQAGVGYGLATLFYGNGEGRNLFLEEVMRNTVAGLSPDFITRRAEMASSWRYIGFYSLTCFAAAGLGEEVLKFLPVVYAHRRSPPKEREPRNRAYLDYAMAASLAFGVVEGIGFLYTACERGSESGSKLALTVLERLVLGSCGHILMAVLSALRATRRDYCGETHLSWWKVLGPSVLVHGFFDAAALAFSSYEGNVGWIHPESISTTAVMLTTAVGVWAGTAWMVWREFKLLAAHDKKE